jgi:hypothetical protein
MRSLASFICMASRNGFDLSIYIYIYMSTILTLGHEISPRIYYFVSGIYYCVSGT